MIKDIQESNINRLKDTIINCLVNQLDCCRDIRNLKTKCYSDMSNCLEKQTIFYKTMVEFDKQLSEFDEKLSKFDKELRNNLKDYIDNCIEVYLKEKMREREYNTIKVWCFFFLLLFILWIVYYILF